MNVRRVGEMKKPREPLLGQITIDEIIDEGEKEDEVQETGRKEG